MGSAYGTGGKYRCGDPVFKELSRETAGHETAGHETTGHETAGRETAGRETVSHETVDHEMEVNRWKRYLR